MINDIAKKRFFGLISLCQKARVIQAGEAKAENAVRTGSARLIIVTEDASDNTKKKFLNGADYHNIPIIFTGNRYELGRSIGREFAVTCCVTEDGFAKKLMEIYNG